MSSEAIIALVAVCVTVLLALVGGTATIVIWITTQFSRTRKALFDKLDDVLKEIEKKLEYHEAHDDDRFADVAKRHESLRDDLWQHRLDHSLNVIATNGKDAKRAG